MVDPSLKLALHAVCFELSAGKFDTCEELCRLIWGIVAANSDIWWCYVTSHILMCCAKRRKCPEAAIGIYVVGKHLDLCFHMLPILSVFFGNFLGKKKDITAINNKPFSQISEIWVKVGEQPNCTSAPSTSHHYLEGNIWRSVLPTLELIQFGLKSEFQAKAFCSD